MEQFPYREEASPMKDLAGFTGVSHTLGIDSVIPGPALVEGCLDMRLAARSLSRMHQATARANAQVKTPSANTGSTGQASQRCA
eukprot:4630326-Amphidinium_carterae.1